MFEEGGFDMARRLRRRATRSLEHELRLYRPRPVDDFFRQVTTRILADAPQRPARRLSLAFAGALASLLIAAFAAFGGIGYAASAAKGVARTAHQVVSPDSKNAVGQLAAADQYVGKVTICHHTGSRTHPFVTITINRSALPAHLKHGDTEGPCTGTLGAQATRGGLGASAAGSSLPFAGFGLLGVVLIGALTLGTGVALRRSSRT
jgi:Cu/Ag efflux protein CusF